MPRKSYGYNRTALLIITAICTFVFSAIIKIVDGTFPLKLLAVAGLASVAAIISLISNYVKLKKDPDGEMTTETQY